MPTIAIVGAGTGLGLSLARTFGAQGFSVALISRNEAKLDALVAELASDGITDLPQAFEAITTATTTPTAPTAPPATPATA